MIRWLSFRNISRWKRKKGKTIMKRAFGTFFLFVLLTHSVSAASAFSQNTKNIKFKHLTVDDGLSHHETLFVMQDTQGFMWFGTKHGLNKYDGMRVISYFHDHDSDHRNSLIGNFAHWIHEDQAGALWIATWGDGISKYDPESDKFFSYQHEKNNPQSLAANNVWSLFADSRGFVWAATDNGLSRLDPETKKCAHYQHDSKNKNSLSNNTVSGIREDDQGGFWISTYGGGLNRFDPETETFKNYKHIPGDPKRLSNNNLWCVFIDSRKRIWTGSEKGLNRFDPVTETFKNYQHDKTAPDSLSSNTVTCIHEDHSGMLWLGTFGGGLNLFDPVRETSVHYRHNSKDPYSLSNDIIMSIYEDTAGAIWVATYDGIDKYDPDEYQFDYYPSDPDNRKGLNNHKVRSIYQDQSGSVWMGTGGGGLNRLNKTRDSDVHYLHDDNDPGSISGNDIWAIRQDKRGDLWIATHGAGLNRFSPDQDKFIRYEHDPENINTPACDPLYDLAVDNKRDVLWIAAYLSGLDKFDIRTNTFTHYRYDPKKPDGIVSNWSTVVFADSGGLVWVGTEAGLSIFNPDAGQFTNFKHTATDLKSLSANMILSIYEDSRNFIWIGTSDGLNRYEEDTHTFKRYSEQNGLTGNYVAGITEDNNGNLWISSDKGLSKFNPQDETFRNYDQNNGLQGNRFLMHAVHKNDDGELLFGGTNGFNAFTPDELTDNHYIPNVVFTGFQLFNQPVPVGEGSPLKRHISKSQQISLEYEQHVFSIEFAALNYRNSNKNQYAYMMEGFDRDYTYTDSNNRSITYTNLDPGKYTFHVKGSNNDGVWNEEGASIEIIISPPWWKTYWFNGLLILLVAGFIFGVIRFKIHSVERLNRQLEMQVKERTSELAESNKILKDEIAERVEIERALKWRDFQLTETQKVAKIGNWDLDLVTSKLDWSNETYKLFDKDPNDFVPGFDEFTRLVHPNDLETMQTKFNNALENDENPYHVEIRIINDSGREWVMEAFGKVTRDKNGKALSIFGTARDVTERSLVEALRESEEKYRLAMDATTDGLWDWNISTGVVYYSPSWSKMLDENEVAPEYESWENRIHSDDKAAVHSTLQEHIEGKSAYWEKEHRIRTETGKWKWVLGRGRVVEMSKEGQPLRMVGTMSDITDRKELESRLQQSQKMESIGTLAGGIAHDFNNILYPIIGYAEMLLEDIPENSPFQNSISEIFSGAMRASELVKQILTFSRQDHVQVKPMRLQPVIEEVLKLIRATIPASIKIEQNVSNSCGIINADPTQIHQVIMNLATNAYHAMVRTGGQLKVSLKEIELREQDMPGPWMNLDMKPGSYACLTVSDTGVGMDKDVTEKIFDPFFTTKEESKGTGMGLSVVHGIVHNSGGSIQVDSDPGKGSQFFIYLPVVKSDTAKREHLAKETIQHGTERILLVDDEKAIVAMEKNCWNGLAIRLFHTPAALKPWRLFEQALINLIWSSPTWPCRTCPEINLLWESKKSGRIYL